MGHVGQLAELVQGGNQSPATPIPAPSELSPTTQIYVEVSLDDIVAVHPRDVDRLSVGGADVVEVLDAFGDHVI